MKSYKEEFFAHITALQNTICSAFEKLDGRAIFKEDKWERPGGGGGQTRVISNGAVFEKGGVNISGVHGKLPPQMVEYLNVSNNQFYACGLSLVMHPTSPLVPTVHANFRYFELYDDSGNVIDQWFAGGADMTPYYIFEEDVVHFHKVWKDHCDVFGEELYPKYKKACDDYFYNSHRNEARGIGGIFFDYLRENDKQSSDQWKDFTIGASNKFLESYLSIVQERNEYMYTDEHRTWQEIRRGRYVEFNLIHDKGTLFGLRTNGRIESILMSLPPHVQWTYNHQVEAGSAEDELIQILKNPKDWV